METNTRKRPIDQEITLDKDAPQLAKKYPAKKRESMIDVPPEKAEAPMAVPPNVDDILNELLIKTEPKVKTKPIEDVVPIQKKIEISPLLHNNHVIDNAPPPLYQRPNLSHESLMTDIAYKEVVKQIDELGTALGKDLIKSQELAQDWKNHILALDKYIKSLEGLPWRRMLSYSACFLLVGAFMWKMGALRVLPDFLGTVIKLIPTPGMSSTTMQETVAELPKPSVTSTINAIAESPVAVFGIVAGVSMGVICVGLMKITILALKRLPK